MISGKSVIIVLVSLSVMVGAATAQEPTPPKIISWSNSNTVDKKTVFMVQSGKKVTFTVKAEGAEKYVWLVNDVIQQGADAALFKWTTPREKGMWKICVKTTNKAREEWAQKDAAVWKDRFKPRLDRRGRKVDFSEFIRQVIDLNVYPFESRKEWIVSTFLTKVKPGESIQKAIDSLPVEGGIVQLAPGVHDVRKTIYIKRSNVVVYGTRKAEVKAHDPVKTVFIIPFDPENLEIKDSFSTMDLNNFVFKGFKVTSTFTERRGVVIRTWDVDNLTVEGIENFSYLKCILHANPTGGLTRFLKSKNVVVKDNIGHHSAVAVGLSDSTYIVNNTFMDTRGWAFALFVDEPRGKSHVIGNYVHGCGTNASIGLDVGGGPYNARNNVVNGNGYSQQGIYFSSGVHDSIVINNTITGTTRAGIKSRVQSRFHNVLIANNRIYNCKGPGIWMSELPHGRKHPNCNVDIVNNVIYNNNGDGIRVDSEHFSSVNVSNNIITNNKGYGINRLAGKITLGYNDIWNNVQGNYNECTAGTGDISVAPLFADPTKGDFHLKSKAGRWEPKAKKWVKDNTTSPCIDAGDPKVDFSKEPAPDGGRVNMGAYGNTKKASKSAVQEK